MVDNLENKLNKKGVQHLDKLPDIDKEIILSLRTKRENALTAKQIQDYIKDRTDETHGVKEIGVGLYDLIKYGAVRAVRVEESGKDVMKYYLSRGIGSGSRNYDTLTGGHGFLFFKDIGRFFKRITGAFLTLLGIGLVTYQQAQISGAVTSVSSVINENFILPASLMCIGLFLVYKSFTIKK